MIRFQVIRAFLSRRLAGQVATLGSPLKGSFSWRWPSAPASLRAQWQPGSPTVMVKGALMAFMAVTESSFSGYTADDQTVTQLADGSWQALLAAAAANRADPGPYSYVHVSESLPETLTLWENGATVLTTPANTGIAAAPTALGTYPIYVRYTFNYMSGFNPDGSYYHDPVYWINYFNGGDAVHGFVRVPAEPGLRGAAHPHRPRRLQPPGHRRPGHRRSLSFLVS